MKVITARKKLFGIIAILLSVLLLCGIMPTVAADYASTASRIVADGVSPKSAEIGGEWSVIGLARGGYPQRGSFESKYFAAAKALVSENKGMLDRNKSCAYSRMIIALCAIGQNPKSISGYNLFSSLSDMNFVTKQGLNGAVFALIALDCGNFSPTGNVTRQKLICEILSRQVGDGGFSVADGAKSDVDMTAMTLQALAPYKAGKTVGAAVKAAIEFLSSAQEKDGGFSSGGVCNSESASQTVIALCTLGISPKSDARFVKNGFSALSSLFSFGLPDGSFRHTAEGKANLMATEQALCALAAYKRFAEGGSTLFDMSGYTCRFGDIGHSAEKEKIVFLNRHGIISGVSDKAFEPSKGVTRAEFCTMLSKTLGLNGTNSIAFSDVRKSDWFYPYVCGALSVGIVNGKENGRFAPNDGVTREEAAAMLYRAARAYSPRFTAKSDTAANGYQDSSQISAWAKESVAYCLSEGIYTPYDGRLSPKAALSREELAAMFFGFWFLM